MNTLLDRIEINPNIMTGKPVIKGTRLTVKFILGLQSHGTSVESILAEYPHLSTDDIYACIEFASAVMEDNTFVPIVSR